MIIMIKKTTKLFVCFIVFFVFITDQNAKCCSAFNNLRTEWHERQFCYFEALLSEGYSDDRDTENGTANCCFNGQRNTGYNDPKNVQYQRTGTAAIAYFLSEGK